MTQRTVSNVLYGDPTVFPDITALKAATGFQIGARARIAADDRDFELTGGTSPEAGNTYQGMNVDSAVSGAFWKVLNGGYAFLEWFGASTSLSDNTAQIKAAVEYCQSAGIGLSATDGAVFDCDVSSFTPITIASRDWVYLAPIRSNTLIRGNFTIRISAPGTDLTAFFLSAQGESSIENVNISGVTFENTNLATVADSRSAGVVFHAVADAGEGHHRNLTITDITLKAIKNGVMFWEDLNGLTGLEETWGMHNINVRGVHASDSHSAVVWMNSAYNINVSDITVDGISYDIITCHGGQNINVSNIAQREVTSADEYATDAAVDALNFVVNSSGRNIRNVNIVNCHAYEVRANVSSSGAVAGTKLENFNVVGGTYGGITVENGDSANCTIDNVKINGAIVDCQNLDNGSFPKPTTLRGLFLSQADDVSISDVSVRNNRWQGIFARFCDDIVITGFRHMQDDITNTEATDQSAGIHLDNVRRFNVSDAKVKNVFGPGIYLDNCDFGTVRDVRIEKVDLTGKLGLYANRGVFIEGGADTVSFKGMFILGGVDSIYMDATGTTGSNFYTSIEFKDITFDSPSSSCFTHNAVSGTENTDFFGIVLSDYRIHGAVTAINFPYNAATRGPLLKGGELQVGVGGLLAVSSNSITPTHRVHYVDNTAGAVTVNDITGVIPGSFLTIIPRSTSNNLTVSHVVGNIRTQSGANVVLSGPNANMTFMFDGDDYIETSNS